MPIWLSCKYIGLRIKWKTVMLDKQHACIKTFYIIKGQIKCTLKLPLLSRFAVSRTIFSVHNSNPCNIHNVFIAPLNEYQIKVDFPPNYRAGWEIDNIYYSCECSTCEHACNYATAAHTSSTSLRTWNTSDWECKCFLFWRRP